MLVIAPNCPLTDRRLPVPHKATVGNTAGCGGRGSRGSGLCRRVCLSAAVECGCDDTQAFGNETLEWCQIELKSRYGLRHLPRGGEGKGGRFERHSIGAALS